MPQGWRCREIEMSCSPASSSRTTSLRRIWGSTESAPERMGPSHPGPDALEHRVAVGAQPKEVIALTRRDQLERGVLHAVPVHDLRPGLEFLAPGAVEPLVLGFEQILRTALPDALEQGGDRAGVPRLRGPDPVVVAAAEAAPVLGERV